MKKISLALITFMFFGVIAIKAQDQILSASGPISNGCLSHNNGKDASSLPTIKLTKESSILSVDLLNYVSNCGTTSFEVESRLSVGNDDTPSVVISVAPVVPAAMDCTCPFNISYTIHGIENNKFYLTCWWYEGEVELTEGEPLVLEYKTEDVVIDGLKFTLLKTSHQAKLLLQDTWEDEAEILLIPSEVEYEGEKYIVTSINGVFGSNSVIRQITIPKTIKNTDFGSMDGITSNLFSGCLSLEMIEVDEENPVICSLDGVLFNKNKTTLISYPAASPRESYYVPDDVKTTVNGAFLYSQHLKKIVLPDNMETMGINLFGYSNSLEEVILPSNIKELPVYLFKDCKKLKSVDMPKDLTTIGYSAFEGCSALESISLPESVVTVGMAAFMGCTSLNSAILSPNLKEIPLAMFSGCSKLSEVIIPSGITSIGSSAFIGCEAMQSFDLPGSINFIDGFAFGRLPNLKDIYCHSTTVPNTKNNAFYETDLSQATLHVPAVSVSAYQAVEPWKNFKEIVALPAQESDTDDSNYIPFVEAGKQWHVARFTPGHNDMDVVDYHIPQGIEEINGNNYYKMKEILNNTTEIETYLVREENRKVYFFDKDTQKEYLMFDYSLKKGDIFEGYSNESHSMVRFKVVSVEDCTEGPQVKENYYDETADTMAVRYRYFRKWAVAYADFGAALAPRIWIEGIGSLRNPFSGMSDGYSSSDHLTYIIYNGQSDKYLPFSFNEWWNKEWFGCNLPIGEEYENSEDGHHQLTYELEGNRLHVYGKVFCNCGPNHYAYFVEEPREQTDDPLVRKFHFEIQDVEPLMWCEGLHATDFYVEGVNPAYDYIIVDNQGEEHHVINKAPLYVYRPFVEDNKVWVVKVISDESPTEEWIEYYYFDGDTIINGQTAKRMLCDRIASRQDTSGEYVGAWYEQNKEVYFAASGKQQFELLYDFSLINYDTMPSPDGSTWIVYKWTGIYPGFKGTCFTFGQESWYEGVGSISWPFVNHPWGYGGDKGVLLACSVGDEVIYYNSTEGYPYSMGVRKRFDFTHTIKIKPKARMRSGENQSLYGEYNDLLLGINLDPLDDAYLVSITDETGKVVYEKSINAGNIVGLNIDISAYAKGRYTVTMENNRESFTGTFEAQTTGINEIRSKRSDVRSVIYNLQGQRISTLQKGLNIVNGQKVFVK